MIARTLAFLLRAVSALGSRYRNLFYRFAGCQIDGYVWLRRIRVPRQWSDVRIRENAALDEGVVLLCSGDPAPAKIDIGPAVYLNRGVYIDASHSIVIEDDTMIGPNTYITDHDHAYAPGEAPGPGSLQSQPTRIGKRVWIGANVIVLKGVIIGDDVIVGAGSVVTRDVPARSIAVGTPARVIRTRDS